MPYKLLAALASILMLSMTGMHSLADPVAPLQSAPQPAERAPRVLILASYHHGDPWTDKVADNLQYHFESLDQNIRVRTHYLDAHDLPADIYLDGSGLYNDPSRLRQHDRVVMIDDPALALYLQHVAQLPDQQPVAIGINNTELIARAHSQGVQLALTSEAMVQSAALAREVTNQSDLLLLHSATESGLLLKEQALQQFQNSQFDNVTSRTWLSIYEDGIEHTDQAILALDSPLILARDHTASVLANHFREKLEPFFCYTEPLRAYGCDGGAFVNITSLTQLVVHQVMQDDNLAQAVPVPLELSLDHALLDQLPQGLEVNALNVPEPSRLPRWGQSLILLLALLLVAVAGFAWSRLRSRQALVETITREAEYDPVTQLYSRRKILFLLEQLIDQGEAFHVLYMDLDGFKEANDTLGHAHGDRLLQGFGKMLRSIARERASYGRIGGDEFLVLCHQEKSALGLAKRVTKALENPFIIEGQHHTLRCSIGIAQFPQHAQSIADLLECADIAMYAAKAASDESIALFTQQMLSEQARHTSLSHDLEHAIDSGGAQFELHIQPIHSLKQAAIIGGEVLLRWKHPTEGYISPGLFIPIAEASDLILKLNDWVVERTIQRIAADQLHRRIGYLAINISARQLYARQFACDAIALAERFGVPKSAVSFEMTEHVRLLDMSSVQQQITALREAGFGVALDDFGAGYTSISFLQDIPFSCVKIDRSLTSGLCGDNAATSRNLMQGLLYLSERLSQQVVVEGVETAAESELLKEMGADHVQGFYYYRPMPWDAFNRLVGTG